MDTQNRFHEWKISHPDLWQALLVVLVVLLLGVAWGGGILVAFLANTPVGSRLSAFSAWLLGTNTTHMTWYITRAAGMVAYLLLWLSTAWGLAVSSRILDGSLHGAYTYDFHQFISLLAIGFTGLHMVILLADSYMPFTLGELLFPFVSAYRPLWVGVGVLSTYLTVLVTVTFYLRHRIGAATFRAIHTVSLLAFAGAGLHGLMAGTDSIYPAAKIMYAATFLSVVFLLTYWLVLLLQKRMRAARVAQRT